MDAERLAHIEAEAAPDAPFRDEMWLALQVPDLLAYVRELEAVADAARELLRPPNVSGYSHYALATEGAEKQRLDLERLRAALDAAKPP
jgi:hypothetical protein